jgi:hypothetical protein
MRLLPSPVVALRERRHDGVLLMISNLVTELSIAEFRELSPSRLFARQNPTKVDKPLTTLKAL